MYIYINEMDIYLITKLVLNLSINENNNCIMTFIILKKNQSGHREAFCKSSLHQGITQIFFVYAIRCIKVVALSP